MEKEESREEKMQKLNEDYAKSNGDKVAYPIHEYEGLTKREVIAIHLTSAFITHGYENAVSRGIKATDELLIELRKTR